MSRSSDERPDRSRYPTRLTKLHDPRADDDYVLSLTPSERIEMVWPITLDAWSTMEGSIEEPRVRRDIVRIIRGKR